MCVKFILIGSFSPLVNLATNSEVLEPLLGPGVDTEPNKSRHMSKSEQSCVSSGSNCSTSTPDERGPEGLGPDPDQESAGTAERASQSKPEVSSPGHDASLSRSCTQGTASQD